MAGPRGTNSPSEQHYNLTESPARTPIRARWWEVTAAQVALVPFYTPRTAEPLGHSNSAKQQRALTESPARIPILVRLSGMAAEGQLAPQLSCGPRTEVPLGRKLSNYQVVLPGGS